MGSLVSPNVTFLLAMILISFCMNVFGSSVVPPAIAPVHHHYRHHHHHVSHPPALPPIYLDVPPSHPPVKPRSHPPVKPPSHPPVKPPSHPPVKPPSHPPVKPPSHPPVKPPSHPPVKPPSHPPVKPPVPHYARKLVAVQGVVYCKSCKYTAADTLFGAKPLSGAIVKLQCNNTKYPLQIKGTTDKNGYFLIHAPKTITTFGVHKCKVSLVRSPLKKCNVPTNLGGGLTGARLVRDKKDDKNPAFELYSVGPLAFAPPSNIKCPRY